MSTLAQDMTDADAVVAMGRRAIATEAEALWSLAHALDPNFADAVSRISATHGRVIVCGLGKSGQIAQKIASTFSATGTPSSFLHAGDAVHGDLGAMTRGDTLIILSNSGDTREFGVIMRRAAALAIPIIAITSSVDSPVASQAQIVLLLAARPEACPYGSSPTTSTTMMLALGDALAVTMMQLRGMKAADLLAFHPGGRLGLDLVAVDSFMHRADALPLAHGDAPMDEVLDLIGAKGFGVAGIIDAHHRLTGVITDGDIRRRGAALAGLRADQVMTTRPRTLEIGSVARDALIIMSEARITSVFVIGDAPAGTVRGLVHIHDLLRLGIA